MIEQALKENENKEKFIDFSKNANKYNLSHVKWFFYLKIGWCKSNLENKIYSELKFDNLKTNGKPCTSRS